MNKEKALEALKKLRQTEKKVKFSQTVDLIINLKNFDAKKEAFNIFIELPHKIKDKKIAGFLEKKSSLIDSITKEEFVMYKEKADIKRLVKKYDFFIANAKLMPVVATSFGRVLGPVGKMPSPQLGVLMTENDHEIKKLIDKINSNTRIRVKESSIKLAIGNEAMKDESLAENTVLVYNKVLENLKRGTDNIRNIMIKLTMDKPIKI